MFKLPTKLRIGAFHYKCELVHKDADYEGQSDGQGEGYIRIVESLPDKKKASTLFHEMCHCIFHEWNLDFKSIPKKDVEEKVIEALESGFTGFAEDHQRVFQAIVKAMGEKL